MVDILPLKEAGLVGSQQRHGDRRHVQVLPLLALLVSLGEQYAPHQLRLLLLA